MFFSRNRVLHSDYQLQPALKMPKASDHSEKPVKLRPHVGRSAERRNARKSVIAKAKGYFTHISFKVHGEDAQMARVIGNYSNFSNICLYALRAYYLLIRKFYGPGNLLSLKTDRLAPPPYEYLLVPLKVEKFRELAALSQELEARTGRQVSIEQLMARAVAGVSVDDLEKMPDPFPDLSRGLFEIYAENLTELPKAGQVK